MSSVTSGLMHSIKGKLFAGEKHVDADYESAFSRFTLLHDSVVRLKSSAQSYSNSLYSSLYNSGSVATEFGGLLEDPVTENGYEVISKQMIMAHGQLNSDRQSALTARMSEGVLAPLDKFIVGMMDLNGRIAKRNESHANLEYYLGKVAELNKEREERSAKGKVESTSQRDKHERNQAKLDTARAEYAQLTSPLITELHSLWESRATVLGPILAAFASVEKEFVQVYGSAIEQVHPEQIGAGEVRRPSTVAASSFSAGSTNVSPQASTIGASALTTGSGTASTASPTMTTVTMPTTMAANPTPALYGTGSTITSETISGGASSSSSSANVFGDINEQQPPPVQSTTASLPVGTQEGGIASYQPPQSQDQASAGNPFDDASSSSSSSVSLTQPAHAPAQDNILGLQQSTQQLNLGSGSESSSAPGGVDLLGSIPIEQQSGLVKGEHDEESKRQRYEEDNKTIMGM